MNTHPSEYPNTYVSNILQDVYETDSHSGIEQSAIYSDVPFNCISENGFGIILTSQCDIEKYDPENFVLVARVAPVGEILLWWLISKNGYSEDEVSGKVPISKKKRKGIIKAFTNDYLRNNTFAYYFIPALESKFKDSFICCEITECIAIKNLPQENKICVLRSPFREAIPTHFSAYIGRIGTPIFQDDFLEKVMGVCRVRSD